MTFKVGDRVRYIPDGDEGRITSVTDQWLEVEFDTDGIVDCIPEEVEVITEEYSSKPETFAETVAKFASDTISTEDAEQLKILGEQLGISSFEENVRRHTDKIATLLIAKNKAYGDSALNPVRIFSKASRIEQLNVRIDDKISRIQRGTDFGDEDTVRDLIGYLVLRLIAEESE